MDLLTGGGLHLGISVRNTEHKVAFFPLTDVSPAAVYIEDFRKKNMLNQFEPLAGFR